MDIIETVYNRHNAETRCNCPSCGITRSIYEMDALIVRTNAAITNDARKAAK